jgi:hypothetical protein
VSIGRLAQIPRLVAPLVWMGSQLRPMTSIDAAGIGREAVGRVVHHQRSITTHHWSDLTEGNPTKIRGLPRRFMAWCLQGPTGNRAISGLSLGLGLAFPGSAGPLKSVSAAPGCNFAASVTNSRQILMTSFARSVETCRMSRFGFWTWFKPDQKISERVLFFGMNFLASSVDFLVSPRFWGGCMM